MNSESPGPRIERKQVIQLTVNQLAEQRLTQEERQAMNHWDRRLARREDNPFPLLPTAYREGRLPMSPEVYEEILTQTGAWMDSYMRKRLACLEGKTVRGSDICLHFGIGVGRGMGYLEDAHRLGLDLRLHDWSEVALAIGEREILRFLATEKDPDTIDLREMVSWAEIVQFFDSHEWQNDARFVRLAQLAFILEHLELPQVESVVRNVGKMLVDPKNQLVIMDTPLEGNEQFARTTSNRRHEEWMKDFLLRTLTQGSGREVECVGLEEYVNPANQRLIASTYRMAT